MLCDHHLDDPRKRSLYREVFELLEPGGVFANLEFANIAMPLGVGLVTQDLVATAEAAIGVGAYTASQRLRDPAQLGGATPEAALVVDAGRRLADF